MSDERFMRTELMLGDTFSRLQNAFVVVVGLGAVGSYAVEGLARSGVGRLRLVDFDCVGVTNINRQLYALSSTVGHKKCEVARERVADINPACRVEAVSTFLDADTVGGCIGGSPDIVIDAIDSLLPKVELLSAARTAGVPIITCLGAAMRSDASKVSVGTVEESYGCPLGRAVRKRLRRREVPLDIPCVYSAEPLPNPLPILVPADSTEERVVDRGRARNTLGSLPTITGIFGLTAANLAISMLTK